MRSGQKPDVVLLGDLNHGSPHSSLFNSPCLCPHFMFENVVSIARSCSLTFLLTYFRVV